MTKLCVKELCVTRLSVKGVEGDKVGVKDLFSKELCVCVTMLCVTMLYVKELCVTMLFVKELCVTHCDNVVRKKGCDKVVCESGVRQSCMQKSCV